MAIAIITFCGSAVGMTWNKRKLEWIIFADFSRFRLSKLFHPCGHFAERQAFPFCLSAVVAFAYA